MQGSLLAIDSCATFWKQFEVVMKDPFGLLCVQSEEGIDSDGNAAERSRSCSFCHPTKIMSGLNLCAAGATTSSKAALMAASPESPASKRIL